jgi:hypothetical protein
MITKTEVNMKKRNAFQTVEKASTIDLGLIDMTRCNTIGFVENTNHNTLVNVRHS